MGECKYYNKHLETIREYIGCLYELETIKERTRMA